MVNDGGCNGYEIIIDPVTGNVTGQVERATGEIYENRNIDVPAGTFFVTPEQQRQRAENAKKAQAWRQRNATNSLLGRFFFMPCEAEFTDIAPETVTRLVYLATYLPLNDNKLMLTERTAMQRRDLPAVLGLSKATTSRFWNEVCPAYLQEDGSGHITISGDLFKRGRIARRQFVQYQKLYIDGIRTLYRGVEVKQHKRLGYLFRLLPFINLEYNVLCRPECIAETKLKQITLLSVSEFCNLIGFDVKHLNKLVSAYREITFEVNGRPERFCSLTYDGVNRPSAKIFINPHVLFNGSDYHKVEVLGAFCTE